MNKEEDPEMTRVDEAEKEIEKLKEKLEILIQS